MLLLRRHGRVGACGGKQLLLERHLPASRPSRDSPRQLRRAGLDGRDHVAIVLRKELVDRYAEDGLVGQGGLQAGRPCSTFVSGHFGPARGTKKKCDFLLGQRATLPVSP